MTDAALVRSDATAIPLGDSTVDLIITSPPYFALRSYQDGGEHYDGQIGSEPTPTAERAWEPRTPNTSTIRSEQPLMTFG